MEEYAMSGATVVKRDELFERVWNEPAMHVARSLGISPVALGRICRKLDVPQPRRGWWAQKVAGRPVRCATLPPTREGRPVEHVISTRMAGPRKWPAGRRGGRGVGKGKERAARSPVAVRDGMAGAHALVQAAALALRQRGDGDVHPRFQGPCLDVDVCRASLDRALRIMDAVLAECERLHYPVDVSDPVVDKSRAGFGRARVQPSTTGVTVSGVRIEFGIHEERPSPSSPGAGCLVLSIKSDVPDWAHRRWRDTRTQRLEVRLPDFLVWLARIGETLRRERDRRDREARARAAAESRARQEAFLIEDLDRRLADFEKATRIREFVVAVERDALSAGTRFDDESDLANWLRWARRRSEVLAVQAIRTAASASR
jgi:hypothetical protein